MVVVIVVSLMIPVIVIMLVVVVIAWVKEEGAVDGGEIAIVFESEVVMVVVV